MGNSVIYRPAYEAEVEYLESDGNSYIDTGLKASSELGILAHIQVLTNSQWLFGGANGYGNKALSFLFTTGDSSYRYGNEVINLGRLSLNTTYEFDSTQNHNVMKVGSLTFSATVSTFTSDYNLYLFTENRAGVPTLLSSGVRIYDFKIYQNSTLVRDFIPVRIGSVGYMYDKVTKQLFANKGTGNFVLGNDVSNAVIPQQRCVLYFGSQRSVVFERLYEEYEWLVGDGSAYIDTLVSDLTNVDFIRCHYSCTGTMVDNRIFGREGKARITCKANVDNSKLSVWTDSAGFVVNHNIEDDYIEIDLVNNVVSTSLESNNFEPITNLVGTTLYLFGDHGYNVVFPYKIKKFEIDGKLNLIPVKLLQSIPAILDGNGIARQAGECGMWDKVSGRFYGNVASSGSFTVSND